MKRNTFFRFAGPSIIVMTLLMVIPLIMAIWLGMNFITYANINDPQFVGLRNYIEVLQDSRFWQSFVSRQSTRLSLYPRRSSLVSPSPCFWIRSQDLPGASISPFFCCRSSLCPLWAP